MEAGREECFGFSGHHTHTIHLQVASRDGSSIFRGAGERSERGFLHPHFDKGGPGASKYRRLSF